MKATTIEKRVQIVQNTIAEACLRVGRAPESVTLVAVSKLHSAEQVVEAVEAGLRHFGENRLEEALPKMSEVAQLTSTPIHWHLIGHVQPRKARHALAGFVMMHSLDSLKLAERLSFYAAQRGLFLDVLLEINVSGEEAKAGWRADRWRADPDQRQALWDDVLRILALPGLNVRGLMTMAPIVKQAEDARPVFVALRELREALARDFPASDWAELSMGMTDDYPVAVEEGATLVRIGRAIFGPRQ